MRISYLGAAAGVACCLVFSSTVIAQDVPDEVDPYSLVLAPVDLNSAKEAITRFDRDDDGFVAGDELERLSWKDQLAKYDLNRDKKLTHLEFAIRGAQIRSKAGVEQHHVDNAKVFMKRHDKNGNGQLDQAEIENGWPPDPKEFDRNNNGTITLTEIAARFAMMSSLRRELGIEQVDQVTAIRTVKKFDKDNDGKLAKDEREGAFLPLPANRFDENEDGFLEIIEIATMLAKFRRDTDMSQSDLQQLRSLFVTHDKDADGTIDPQEYAAAEQRFGGSLEGHPLQRLDADSNQTLTYDEVVDVLTNNRKSLGFNDKQLADARKMLKRHDTNKNLHIEVSELSDNPAAGELPKSLVKQCDADKDGRISLLELARHLADEK